LQKKSDFQKGEVDAHPISGVSINTLGKFFQKSLSNYFLQGVNLANKIGSERNEREAAGGPW